jgi:hypothetical protein
VTPDGRVRDPVFLGIRYDNRAREVRREPFQLRETARIPAAAERLSARATCERQSKDSLALG